MNGKRGLSFLLGCAILCVTGDRALAWHPATTQAGLAEKAALASRLHHVLARQLGKPLGLFEPIRVLDDVRADQGWRDLWRRLMLLDPNDGTVPNETGANLALFWLTAGAILESTPPERERHHYFDPRDGRGLHDDAGASGAVHRLRLALDGAGGLRGIATGTSFNLTGRPALGWFTAPDNDLGLPAFMDAFEQAAGGATPGIREAALAKALMCLGALGAVLGDVGEPAHVRNDFREANLQSGGAGPWDETSPFERVVSRIYGRAGVPTPTVVVERPSLQSYFTAPDGQGLADRTQAQFFSPGTVPEPVAVDAATTPKEVRLEANRSLTYPRPAVGALQLRRPGRRYQMVDGRRQLAYERVQDAVVFSLDDGVFEDTAAAWLPVVGGYVAGLYNHMVRVGASLSFKETREGSQVTINLNGFSGAANGTVKVFVEDSRGNRKLVGAPLPFSVAASSAPASEASGEQTASAATPSSAPGPSVTLTLPQAASQVAVSVRGQDAAGAFVAVATGQAP